MAIPVELPAPITVTTPRPRLTGNAWREEALTRARELGGHLSWMRDGATRPELLESIETHLSDARTAAAGEAVPRGAVWLRLKLAGGGACFERALGNLDAAEADILRISPDAYLRGFLPSLRANVNRHLDKEDPRRIRIDRLAGDKELTDIEREWLISAHHAANTQRRRDLMRVRSFRNLVFGAAVVLTIVAIALALLGSRHAEWIPVCFNPVEQHKIVCPTAEVPVKQGATDLDEYVKTGTQPHDILLIMIIGVVAAAVAGAVTLRRMKGTSTPFGVPVSLAVLKLPTGALTALLGLLLMRGGFVPGLSALDTSAQIIAWAMVFGYAQQLLTRLVDDQGSGLLNRLGGRGAGGDRELAPVSS